MERMQRAMHRRATNPWEIGGGHSISSSLGARADKGQSAQDEAAALGAQPVFFQKATLASSNIFFALHAHM
jgi:hypothetical protein